LPNDVASYRRRLELQATAVRVSSVGIISRWRQLCRYDGRLEMVM